MADSETAVCNQALTKIGAKRINNLRTQVSNEAEYCRTFFDAVRDTVLRMHEWNCATKRAELAQLVTSPAWGYLYAYQLPGDCLRLRRMDDRTIKFEVEGRTLVTDSPTARVIYTARELVVGNWDSMLMDCIVWRLASELAVAMARTAAIQNQMWQGFVNALALAKGVDAAEGNPEQPDSDTSSFEDARS